MAKTLFGKISVKAFDFELGSLDGAKKEGNADFTRSSSNRDAELGASVASLRSISTGRAIEKTLFKIKMSLDMNLLNIYFKRNDLPLL